MQAIFKYDIKHDCIFISHKNISCIIGSVIMYDAGKPNPSVFELPVSVLWYPVFWYIDLWQWKWPPQPMLSLLRIFTWHQSLPFNLTHRPSLHMRSRCVTDSHPRHGVSCCIRIGHAVHVTSVTDLYITWCSRNHQSHAVTHQITHINVTLSYLYNQVIFINKLHKECKAMYKIINLRCR